MRSVRVSTGGRGRRHVRWTLLVLGVAWLGASLLAGLRTGSELKAGRESVLRAAEAAREGRLSTTARLFEEAQGHFSAASAWAGSPPLRAVGWLPIAGRTPDALLGMARSAEDLASVGGLLTGSLLGAGGPGALLPTDGRIDLGSLRSLGPPVEEARGLLEGAASRVGRLPSTLLVPPLGSARAELDSELDRALELIRTVDALMDGLPWFLGSDAERSYFVGAQNPAELRGTGGVIGSHAILSVRDGSIELGGFSDTTGLPTLPPGAVQAPGPDYSARYDRFGGAGFFPNINMTPDFPSAAMAIEGLYEELTGEAVDGVILIDPVALSYILSATGPVEVPAAGRVLDASNVVAFTTNEAYALFPETARKPVLGAVAAAVGRRLLEGGDPVGLLGALSRAASEGRLLLHVADRSAQAAFAEAGVSGGLPPAAAEVLGVFASNAGGTKIDYYAGRSIIYRVRLLPGGRAVATAAITFRNGAPSSGQPPYVIGPYGLGGGEGADPRFRAGESYLFASAFCGADCLLTGATLDGRPTGLQVERELGHVVLSTYLRIPSGGARTLRLAIDRTSVWIEDRGGGRYAVTLLGQSSLVPSDYLLEVLAPSGTRITWTTPGALRDGDVARWEGQLMTTRTFEVRFERAIPSVIG